MTVEIVEAATTQRRMLSIRLLVLVGLLVAVGPLAIDLYLPALPSMSREFRLNESTIQLTLTAIMVGLAVGQLVGGPISDSIGRRPPLLVGLATYTFASLLCAAAPSVAVLIAARLLQGFAGATCMVVAIAVVRDHYEGKQAARFFSLLMLVVGVSPVFAPYLGSLLLRVLPWRGLFVVLAALAMFLGLAIAARMKETLSIERRLTGGLTQTWRAAGVLVADRTFVAYTLICAGSLAGMFGYVAGSSFVFQGVYHVSPNTYGTIFGINGLGFVAGSQVNGYLVDRIRLSRLMLGGLCGSSLSGLALIVILGLQIPYLPVVIVPCFLMMVSLGFVGPNASSLALTPHPEAAGTGAALLGFTQFTAGAVVAPMVGIAGTASALPMAVLMAAGPLLALGIWRLSPPAPEPMYVPLEAMAELPPL